MTKNFLPDNIKVCRSSLQSLLLFALSQGYSVNYQKANDLMWQLTPYEVLKAEALREINKDVIVFLLEDRPVGVTNYWLVTFT